MSDNGIDRRAFLGAGLAGGGLAGALLASSAPAAHASGKRSRGIARNAIVMVSDGMSFGTLQLADAHLRRTQGKRSVWRDLWARDGVRRAAMQTYPADGWVTDSAAAGSAWSIGEHVNNGAINHTPDGRNPTPILRRARAVRRGTGLVTTTRVTHATPATFVANVPNRDEEDEIARQILGRGMDVVLGGGARHFPDALLDEHATTTLVRTREDLLNADPRGRLLGLFTDSHMSYEIDRVNAPRTSEPSLSEMTRIALERLDRSPDGFVVQIEGGRVDHGAHGNDAAALIFDQIAFDEAIATVLAFAENRDDTLVVVTTDHGNGNPGLSVYGHEGAVAFEKVGKLRFSFDWLEHELNAIETPEQRGRAMPELIERATGFGLDADELSRLVDAAHGEWVDPYRFACGFKMVLGSLMANRHGVAFLSPNHTSDFVELTAWGPGSERVAGIVDNTDLHAMLADALDLPPT